MLEETTLTGVNTFFLGQASFASRSSVDESEPMEVSRWPEPCFSPDLGRAGTWSWAPRLIMPWNISISAASTLGSSPSPGSFSPSPSSSASSPASRSLSSVRNPGSLPSNGGAPRELLGISFWWLDRMKRPLWSRGVDENAGEQPEWLRHDQRAQGYLTRIYRSLGWWVHRHLPPRMKPAWRWQRMIQWMTEPGETLWHNYWGRSLLWPELHWPYHTSWSALPIGGKYTCYPPSATCSFGTERQCSGHLLLGAPGHWLVHAYARFL